MRNPIHSPEIQSVTYYKNLNSTSDDSLYNTYYNMYQDNECFNVGGAFTPHGVQHYSYIWGIPPPMEHSRVTSLSENDISYNHVPYELIGMNIHPMSATLGHMPINNPMAPVEYYPQSNHIEYIEDSNMDPQPSIPESLPRLEFTPTTIPDNRVENRGASRAQVSRASDRVRPRVGRPSPNQLVSNRIQTKCRPSGSLSALNLDNSWQNDATSNSQINDFSGNGEKKFKHNQNEKMRRSAFANTFNVLRKLVVPRTTKRVSKSATLDISAKTIIEYQKSLKERVDKTQVLIDRMNGLLKELSTELKN